MDGPTDVDALADALRHDGVVIDRVMGSGEAQEAHDRIAKLVRETPFPVYVALVERPDGLPSDDIGAGDALAGLLSRRLGDGLYVLNTTGSIQLVYSFGLDANPAQLRLTANSNVEAVEGAMADIGGFRYGTEGYVYIQDVTRAETVVLEAEAEVAAGRDDTLETDFPATISDTDARRLAERALEIQDRTDWTPVSGGYVEVRWASRGLSVLMGGLGGLVIALLLGQTLRGWPRYRRGLPVESVAKPKEIAPPDPDAERARATALLDSLSTRLGETHWDTVRDRDVAGRALGARDAAEPLLASDDVADLVGAQVLARTDARDLARGRSGNGDRLATCFFDPRHPDGTATVSWRLGDGQVEVPCCPACAQAVSKGDVPEHLRLRTRRGTQPYWERDDVWARTGFGAVTDDLARDVLAARAGER